VIFNEATYFAFFLLPCVAAFHLARSHYRSWILAAFGLLFFVFYSYKHFGGAASALCGLVFLWEIALSRLYAPGSRWCVLGMVQALLVLLLFKYFPFGERVWADLGLPLHRHLSIVQVLGISFFTFEFIHYAADVYVGRIDRKPAASSFAAFILFFPTMVAGPIKRFQEFAPQLETARFQPALVTMGITRILAGLTKKHVLADTFSVWSDKLATPALYEASSLTAAGWLLAYAFKIYFDFSGYSDIAIGSGNLFGFRIRENFNWPYLSRNIADFWRRWHISLGRWIYDYVFAPLAFAVGGRIPVPVALLIAFMLCGLWHGADYHFVVWGLWHGMLVAVYHVWRTYLEKRLFTIPDALAGSLTFVCVVAGYAFFALPVGRAVFLLMRIAGVR
jgi:alginate O-acetyltransferase complex protein AlgI